MTENCPNIHKHKMSQNALHYHFSQGTVLLSVFLSTHKQKRKVQICDLYLTLL